MKKMTPRWQGVSIILLVLMTALIDAALAHAASDPMEILKSHVNQAIDILEDSQFNNPDRQNLQEEKIWKVALTLFDFDIIARLALGRNRHRFSSAQLDRFTIRFSDLLKRTYMDKLRGAYQNSKIKIDYLGYEYVDRSRTRAIVMTTVSRDKVETPIDYSMRLQDGHWVVYDIKVEKVSLVQNYRKQFDDILFKETPEQLIGRLTDKLENRDSGGITQ